MRYAGRLAQYCARAAVAILGQVYGTFHSFRVNLVTGEDMLDDNLNKHLRILLGAPTPDTYLVRCDVLNQFLHRNASLPLNFPLLSFHLP